MITRFLRYLCLTGVVLAPTLAHALLDYQVDWSATGTVGDGWGDAVCSAGDVNGDGYSDILVGAPDYSSGQIGEGAVSLYFGSPHGPADSPAWVYASNLNFAQFGHAVSPAGDTNGDGYGDFLVGAPGVSAGHSEEGRVYLFAGGPVQPTLLQTFEIDEEEAYFGYSVAWAGDVNGDGYDDVLAGAPEWGGFGSPFYIPVQGAARIYHGGPNGPDDTPDWSRSGGQEDADFGFSVAGVGDVNGDGFHDILIGQPLYDPGIIDTDHGAAHLFLGSDSGVASSPVWSFYGEGAGDELGTAVAYAGDANGDGYADALIGAPDYTTALGATYFFKGSPSQGLVYVERRTTGNNSASSLSTLGDFNGDGFADVIVGGGYDDRADIFWGSLNGLSPGPTFSGANGYAEIVAGAGDVNGDGIGDFMITDPFADAGAGIVRLFLGGHQVDVSPDELATIAGTVLQAELGRAVSGAGDVDGDGDEELLVGAPGLGGGQVQMFLGEPRGVGTTPDWTVDGTDASGRLGASVAAAGDVNGDGHADVVIGEPGADRVHVYHGGPGGLSPTPSWTYQFAEAGSEYGAAVAGAGDVDGDGYADVVVGAPGWDGTGSERGLFHLFTGSPTGLVSVPRVAEMSQDGARLGAAVAGVGDANGDGYDEVAIGAPGYDLNGTIDRGGLFVYAGGADAMTFLHETTGVAAFNRLGTAVAGAGDVNGDGFADIVVGEPFHDGQTFDEGRVRVLLGAESDPFFSVYTFDLEVTEGGEQFGRSVSCLGEFEDGRTGILATSIAMPGGTARGNVFALSAGTFHWLGGIDGTESGNGCVIAGVGDTNGDGWPEVAVGAPESLGGNQGHVRIHGPVIVSNVVAPVVLPRAERADGTPVALRGALPEADGLRFALEGWLPAGRSAYRLEWQFAETDQAYPPPSAGAWVTGTGPVHEGVPVIADSGVALTNLASYRWRIRVASTNPYLPRGRWLTDQPNGGTLYGLRVIDSLTGVGDDPTGAPDLLRLLSPPYPNPFNPSTTLAFRLPEAGPARLRIYDVGGRLVHTLHDGHLAAGSHEMRWDGRDDRGRTVASGGYHAVLEVKDRRDTRRLTLLK